MSRQSASQVEGSPSALRLFAQASEYLPGGVSAAARINASTGRPFFVSRAAGSSVYDLNGTELIDLNMSFGASLLGHGHPVILDAIGQAMSLGIACGYEMGFQAGLARRVIDAIPSAEMVRFTISGTEAVWYALRVARAFTGRQKVVKFEGHFHGYSDALGYSLWAPVHRDARRTNVAPLPASAGMPTVGDDLVIVLPWNDPDALAQVLEASGHEIAAVVMEPVNHNAGTILPIPGYLETVRELTKQHGVLLVFDEILSGFRTGVGGAQAQYGVTPDLCTLGKALGGGIPISAFAGRHDVMGVVAPSGPAIHSGTYNAHLISVLAASAFLDHVADPTFWSEMAAKESYFYSGLRDVFDSTGLPIYVQALGSRFSLLFGIESEPHEFRDVAFQDWSLANRFYREAVARGVYFHSAWHHGFSAMHTHGELGAALDRIQDAAKETARGPRLVHAGHQDIVA